MADGFIDIIGKISTLVGAGQQIEAIFGGDAPLTIADIVTAIKQEVTAALLGQAVEDQIIQASATLQSTQKFLSIDYLEAVKNNNDATTLYNLLNGTTFGPLVGLMDTNGIALQAWMDQSSDQRTAAKGISICLGLALYQSIVHRERAKYAPTPAEVQTELAVMRDYARKGVQDLAPRLIKLMNDRLACLTYLSDDNPNMTDPNGVPIKQFCTIDSLHDSWFDGYGQSWLFAFKVNDDPNMDYAAALHWSMRATRNVVWSGANNDADDLGRSLGDGWLRYPGSLAIGPGSFADDFRNTCLSANVDFGQWAQGARAALIGLDAIAFGYPGQEQDDWSWCSSCGGLYYAGTPSRCPASSGPHAHQPVSNNYVLRCDRVGTAPRYMSDNWRWCNKCSGLFKDWGTRLCPAGGVHDSSGSGTYELDVAPPIPGTDVRGLSDAQDNWRWCGRCSALHFGSGASVCPAGGAHDSTGSEDYWLGSLGNLPQLS